MITLLLLSLLTQTPVKVMNNSADRTAAAVRCVNASGTAFESCGGSAGGSSWFPDGGVIGIVNQGTSPWVVSLISTTITGTVAVTQSTSPWVVSGTVTTNPPSNASTNIAQYGGTNISTGTGAGGLGIPRVTVSSDSSMTCNAGTNLNTSALALDATLTNRTQKAVVTDGTRDATVKAASTAAVAADTALVVAISPNNTVAVTQSTSPWVTSLISTTITGTVAVTQSGAWSLSANQSVNVAQINGVTPLMGSGATGTGSHRVTAATDSPTFGTANGTIPTQSVLQAGRATAYGSSPTAVTAGNNAPVVTDLEGIPYVNNGHPRQVFCQMAAGTGTTLAVLTGCAAVASNSYYIKSIVMTGGIANAATVPALIRSGTGGACAVATATWATCWHGTAGSCVFYFDPPIKVTVAHEICHIDATVGTKSVMLTGYIAP